MNVKNKKYHEEYTKKHLNYARILAKRRFTYKLSEDKFDHLREKLQEWLDQAIRRK